MSVVLFCVPPKAKPIADDCRLLDKPRCHAAVAGLTIGGALTDAGYDFRYLDCGADADDAGPHREGPRIARYGMTDEELADSIAGVKPSVVLISSLFTFDQVMFEAVARAARRAAPAAAVIAGGIHATAFPEWHLSRDLADFVVLGEGEETIVELLAALARRDGSARTVQGVAFRDVRNNLVRTGAARRVALLDRPWAIERVGVKEDGSFRYLDDLSRRSDVYAHEASARAFVLYGSRGCPMACDYCASTGSFGAAIRHISAERMFADFLFCRRELGVQVFFNQADTFLLHGEDRRFLERVIAYRDASGDRAFVLNNPNAFFVSLFFRKAGSGIAPDTDRLGLLARSGHNVVTLAVETFSARFNRKFDVRRIGPREIADLAIEAKQRGLRTEIYMMYAFPGQTREELIEDIAAAEYLREFVDDVSWSATVLLPQTQYFRRALSEGWVSLKDYRLRVSLGYGFGRLEPGLNFTAMSAEELGGLISDHRLGPGSGVHELAFPGGAPAVSGCADRLASHNGHCVSVARLQAAAGRPLMLP